MPKLSAQSIAVVVLAAGQGSRMGDSPQPTKLLLPWRNGRPLLWHTVQHALTLEPLEVVVVVRPDLPDMVEVLRELPVRCVPNPRHKEGMGSSLALGIGSLDATAKAALLLLGDEPEIPLYVVDKLLTARADGRKPITIPRYGGQVGPPALFDRSIFSELTKLGGDEGARALIKGCPDRVCFVPLTEADKPYDIDTPKDYRSVIRET